MTGQDPEQLAVQRHAREVNAWAMGEDGQRVLLFFTERKGASGEVAGSEVVSIRDVAQRFGWSRARAKGVVKRLVALGVVKEVAAR